MSSKYQAGKRLVWPLTVISLAAVCLWFGADLNQAAASTAAASVKGKKTNTAINRLGAGIPGTGTGAIPDGPPAQCGTGGSPLEVLFDGSGLSGSITNVTISINATHTWVGDVDARLIAPDMTEHIIFSRTSGTTSPTTCGSSDNLVGVDYVFDNAGTGDWWAQPVTYPAGTYQTTLPGGVPTPGGTTTDMNAAFAAANPTGTWKLSVRDFGGGDTGSINAATLTVTTGGVMPSGTAHVDFDGDGTSDYSVVRDLSVPLHGSETARRAGSFREKMMQRNAKQSAVENLTGGPTPGSSQAWYIRNSSSGTDTIEAFGEAITDSVTPADFDGDGKVDIAIWRGVAPSGPNGAFFFVLNSSDSTLSTIDFGQQGDNPTIVGDYDGDGKADPAVFRCPASPGQCFYFYMGSMGGGGFTTVAWGSGTSSTIFPAAGDYDGDGKYDFQIQRGDPSAPGQGQFILLRSSDNGVEFTNWGLDTDFIAPGDYDGDGRHDITVARNQGGLRVWYSILSGGGNQIAQFGLASDFITPGDYDGDGKTDIAVFRPDADPNMNYHFVYRSSDQMVSIFEYGQNGDYPLANWQVN